jgi:hypothetical protein
MKRTLQISAKCSDLFWARLTVDGKQVGEHDGYVPDWMPGRPYGDYVELTIDLDTGMILNWKKPAQKQLDKTFKKQTECD